MPLALILVYDLRFFSLFFSICKFIYNYPSLRLNLHIQYTKNQPTNQSNHQSPSTERPTRRESKNRKIKGSRRGRSSKFSDNNYDSTFALYLVQAAIFGNVHFSFFFSQSLFTLLFSFPLFLSLSIFLLFFFFLC